MEFMNFGSILAGNHQQEIFSMSHIHLISLSTITQSTLRSSLDYYQIIFYFFSFTVQYSTVM